MRRLRLLVLVGALAGIVPALAPAKTQIALVPGGYGWQSLARWRPNQGELDGWRQDRFALWFHKGAASSVYAAAAATIQGYQGRPMATFAASPVVLAWDRRDDGACGFGAPRWNLVIKGASGQRYVVFLACATAPHRPGAEPGWTRDEFKGSVIREQVLLQAGADALAGTLQNLLIVFDEGPDAIGVVGTPGSVYLDNITVGARVWRSPIG